MAIMPMFDIPELDTSSRGHRAKAGRRGGSDARFIVTEYGGLRCP
jgi:hypothetical protein